MMQLSISNSYLLTSALKDAFNTKILHCNFSPSNVIIIGDSCRLLIDWDLSKSFKPETPKCATRTVYQLLLTPCDWADVSALFQGTWQFLSANLIGAFGGPGISHDFKDNIESSIYVLLWMTLMYLKCSDPKQVPSFLECILDPQPHHTVGGFSKADFLIRKTFLVGLPSTSSSMTWQGYLRVTMKRHQIHMVAQKQYDMLVKKLGSDETLL